MIFPIIQFLRRKGKVSDIEFMAIKEFDGKLVHNEGALTAAGTLCTLTASSGKDLYLAKAVVYVKVDTVNVAAEVATIELQANGVVIETVGVGKESGASTVSEIGYVIHLAGHGIKVAATQILKLEATVLDGAISLEGAIYGFEETTGDSPAV